MFSSLIMLSHKIITEIHYANKKNTLKSHYAVHNWLVCVAVYSRNSFSSFQLPWNLHFVKKIKWCKKDNKGCASWWLTFRTKVGSKNVTSFSSRINVATSKIWRKKNTHSNQIIFILLFLSHDSSCRVFHGCSLCVTLTSHLQWEQDQPALKTPEQKTICILHLHHTFVVSNWSLCYHFFSGCIIMCSIFYLFAFKQQNHSHITARKIHGFLWREFGFSTLFFFPEHLKPSSIEKAFCYFVGEKYYNAVVNANNRLHYFDLWMI